MQQTNNIATLLQQSTHLLTKSSTPRLDAEVILASALKTNRTWLYANSDSIVSPEETAAYLVKVKERGKGVPEIMRSEPIDLRQLHDFPPHALCVAEVTGGCSPRWK